MAVWTLIYGNGTWKVALGEQNFTQAVEKKFLKSVAGY
jgi:hypothetical protein